jgi:hypothetical protein
MTLATSTSAKIGIFSIRLSVIGLLAVAFTAVFDPLEAVTRYPSTGNGRFDTNPYIQQFEGLHLVSRLLEAGRAVLASLPQI